MHESSRLFTNQNIERTRDYTKKIPKELLAIILNFLSPRGNGTFALTSKDLWKLCNTNLFWKHYIPESMVTSDQHKKSKNWEEEQTLKTAYLCEIHRKKQDLCLGPMKTVKDSENTLNLPSELQSHIKALEKNENVKQYFIITLLASFVSISLPILNMQFYGLFDPSRALNASTYKDQMVGSVMGNLALVPCGLLIALAIDISGGNINLDKYKATYMMSMFLILVTVSLPVGQVIALQFGFIDTVDWWQDLIIFLLNFIVAEFTLPLLACLMIPFWLCYGHCKPIQSLEQPTSIFLSECMEVNDVVPVSDPSVVGDIESGLFQRCSIFSNNANATHAMVKERDWSDPDLQGKKKTA